ncbi:MAG: rhomboid family intramembrane serine protease [Defluviitaleaceae bacterium]|nr:rhomboid family intramembrane serine protease [Defluviitaleaceae bacterium]
MYESFVSYFANELKMAGYVRINHPVGVVLPFNIDLWARESGSVTYFYVTYNLPNESSWDFISAKSYIDSCVKTIVERIGARHAVVFHIFIGRIDSQAQAYINDTQDFVLAEQYDMYLGVSNDLKLIYHPKAELNTDKCGEKITSTLQKMTGSVASFAPQPVKSHPPSRAVRNIVKFPVFSIGIIAINIFMFALMEITGGSQNTMNLLRFGAAQYYFAFHNGQWWRFVTPIFLHIGFVHLLFNTMWIAIIGIRLEKFIGHFKFLAIYLISGIAGNVAMMLLSHNAVGAGASGSIFGLFGGMFAYALATKKQPGDLSVQTLAILIILQVGMGFAMPGMIDGAITANSAHIGGLVCGLVLGFVFALFSKKRIKDKE